MISVSRGDDPLTVGHLLLRSARRNPGKIAVAVPGEEWSYSELEFRAWEIARGLAALGVGPGDHVGLLLPNGLDFIAAWFGVSLAGAAIVPINTRYQPPELSYAITHAELKCVLTTDAVAEHVDFLALLGRALPELADASDAERLGIAAAPRLRQVVNLGRSEGRWHVDRKAFLERAGCHPRAELDARQPAIKPDSLAALVFTSGTTSRPKACMHSHRGLLFNWLAARERLKITARDVLWDPLPLFHGQAYGMMMAMLAAGGTFLTQTHFDPEVAFDLIDRHHATLFYPGFHTITARLIDPPRFSAADRTSVRAVLAISPADAWNRSQAALAPAVQFSAYGLQEAGGVVSYAELTASERVRRETCGRPFAGIAVRIIDPDTGAELPSGSYGEILVRGPGLFTGYYRDPFATAHVLDDEGFLHTGDLGTLDEAGRIIYRDRVKSMLKVGGENVAPSEIEAVLLTHPLIAVAVAVAIPDDRLDQVPAAFVELRHGSTLSAEEVIEHCAQRLARFKVPRVVRFVKEWPMSATKIQASKLRDGLLEELAQMRQGGRPA